MRELSELTALAIAPTVCPLSAGAAAGNVIPHSLVPVSFDSAISPSARIESPANSETPGSVNRALAER